MLHKIYSQYLYTEIYALSNMMRLEILSSNRCLIKLDKKELERNYIGKDYESKTSNPKLYQEYHLPLKASCGPNHSGISGS